MVSEVGGRPMMGNNENSLGDEFETEIEIFLQDQQLQEADDREKALNMYRSGSAPPTVEGSLSAVGGLLNNNRFMSEEELRLQGGGSSAMGDRRKVNKHDSRSNGWRSPFAMPQEFNDSKKAESENEMDKLQGSEEWGGDGLISLLGLGLSKKKSTAELFQSLSGHSSRIESVAFDSAEVLVLAEASSAVIMLWKKQKEKIELALSQSTIDESQISRNDAVGKVPGEEHSRRVRCLGLGPVPGRVSKQVRPRFGGTSASGREGSCSSQCQQNHKEMMNAQEQMMNAFEAYMIMKEGTIAEQFAGFFASPSAVSPITK